MHSFQDNCSLLSSLPKSVCKKRGERAWSNRPKPTPQAAISRQQMTNEDHSTLLVVGADGTGGGVKFGGGCT
jgi:hypothetical protein